MKPWSLCTRPKCMTSNQFLYFFLVILLLPFFSQWVMIVILGSISTHVLQSSPNGVIGYIWCCCSFCSILGCTFHSDLFCAPYFHIIALGLAISISSSYSSYTSYAKACQLWDRKLKKMPWPAGFSVPQPLYPWYWKLSIYTILVGLFPSLPTR
jgi:hypothetical protein